MVTSLLPLAVSKFTAAAGNDPDVASLAAILTGACAYLNISGTHTLVNSFVSPAIFLGLAGLLELISFGDLFPPDRQTRTRKHQNLDHPDVSQYTKSNGHVTQYSNGKENPQMIPTLDESSSGRTLREVGTDFVGAEPVIDDENNNLNKQTLGACMGLLPPIKSVSDTGDNAMDIKEDIYCERRRNTRDLGISDQGYASVDSRSSSTGRSSVSSNGIDRTRRNSNHNLAPDLDKTCLGATDTERRAPPLASSRLSHDRVRGDICQTFFTDLLFGCLLSLAVYSRPDAAMFVTAVLLPWSRQAATHLPRTARPWAFFLGVTLGLGLGAASDICFYGDLVLSPVNWFFFNVWNSLASQLFGVSGAFFYLHRVFFPELGMTLASSVFMLAVLYACLSLVVKRDRDCPALGNNAGRDKIGGEKNSWSDPKDTIRYTGPDLSDQSVSPAVVQVDRSSSSLRSSVFTTLLLGAIYSCVGHKEERFLHDVVVLFLVTVSEAIVLAIKSSLFKSSTSKVTSVFKLRQSMKTWRVVSLCLVLCVYLPSQIQSFQSSAGGRTAGWVFSASSSGRDTSQCFSFLSRQSDVTGVYMERNFQDSGGYSLLHQNVPLFHLMGEVFVEYTASSMYQTEKACIVSEGDRSNGSHRDRGSERRCNRGFYSVTTVSDVVHKDNRRDVLRKLVGPPLPPSSPHKDDGRKPPHGEDSTRDSGTFQSQRQHHSQYPHYNYAIVRFGKEFLSPAFRPVFQTPSVWLWRRVDKPDTENWLHAQAGHTRGHHVTNTGARTFGPGHTAALEKEGEVLKQMGNYWQALRRFQTLISITKGEDNQGRAEVKVSVLASAAFCLHRLGETQESQRLLRKCMVSYPRGLCMDGGRPRVHNLDEISI